MVYNALKLFMEINPDLFDAAMQQYKQRKLEYVLTLRGDYYMMLTSVPENASTPSSGMSSGSSYVRGQCRIRTASCRKASWRMSLPHHRLL